MLSEETNARANVAARDEDLRIATKHREEAAARELAPDSFRSYETALRWEETCREARRLAGCHLRDVLARTEPPTSTADVILRTIERSDAAEIKTRQLAAELAILEEYDATRHGKGHDYGSGQRRAELSRRRRELDSRDPLSESTSPTKEELAAAFERVGRPKLRRAESELFRRETPATSRTLRSWAMVERWATGARDATPAPIVEPPATTEDAILRAIERSDRSAA